MTFNDKALQIVISYSLNDIYSRQETMLLYGDWTATRDPGTHLFPSKSKFQNYAIPNGEIYGGNSRQSKTGRKPLSQGELISPQDH